MRKPHILSPIWFAICAILFVAIIHGASFDAIAQASNTNSQSSEQQKLTDAQTKYYEAQAAKVNEDRSTWQKVINLSAFLAALVAVLSLVLNYSSTLKTQRDSQFLEALKRFGDKDSASVRASAAGLLAKLSTQSAIILRWRRPNFDLVLDQLMAGLVLEENSVCVASIIDAVRHLATIRAVRVIERISATNLRVQKDMVRALARFIATTVPDEKRAIEAGNHWSLAAASTPYTDHVLHTLALRYPDDFREECRSAIQESSVILGKAKSQLTADRLRGLSSIAHRLSLNVELCAELLKSLSTAALAKKHARQGLRLPNVFLVNADLSFAILPKIDLEFAQLQGVDLRWAELEEARLVQANLQSANLRRTVLRKASLIGAVLQGAEMVDAKLQEAYLTAAKLQPLVLTDSTGAETKTVTSLEKANLEGADLEWAYFAEANAAGAIFTRAKLANTKLAGMIVQGTNPYDEQLATFENCDWWAANFYLGEHYIQGDPDKDLLEFLVTHYQTAIAKDPKAIHPSVQKFLNEKNSQTLPNEADGR